MIRSRLTIAARIALAVAAFGVTAAIAHSSEPPAWKRALELRSQALDQRYSGTTLRSTNPQPDWRTALEARSAALDRRYGLVRGTHAGWYVALLQRSEALDRRYRLGRYADAP
jgi:hypothetical protein